MQDGELFMEYMLPENLLHDDGRLRVGDFDTRQGVWFALPRMRVAMRMLANSSTMRCPAEGCGHGG